MAVIFIGRFPPLFGGLPCPGVPADGKAVPDAPVSHQALGSLAIRFLGNCLLEGRPRRLIAEFQATRAIPPDVVGFATTI
jgi:hypothetical protein